MDVYAWEIAGESAEDKSIEAVRWAQRVCDYLGARYDTDTGTVYRLTLSEALPPVEVQSTGREISIMTKIDSFKAYRHFQSILDEDEKFQALMSVGEREIFTELSSSVCKLDRDEEYQEIAEEAETDEIFIL